MTMFRSGGKSLRTFGWLICLAGCTGASFPWRPPALPNDSARYPINASTPPAGAQANPAAGQTPPGNPSDRVAAAPYPRTSDGRLPATPTDPQDVATVLAELE